MGVIPKMLALIVLVYAALAGPIQAKSVHADTGEFRNGFGTATKPDHQRNRKRRRRHRPVHRTAVKTNIVVNRHSKHSPPPNTDTGGTEMKKAGEFKGDVRNLPRTKPVPAERPRPADPPIVRRTLPTPKPTP